MNIKELEDKIIYYSTLYYNGEPAITDEQFDALVEKLRELNPNSSVLTTGWGFEVFGDKVKHKYSHIGSLDKTKTYEDIPDRFKQKTIFISPKLDGLSAVAYYYKGELVKGVTRGDGNYGKDITDKLKIILGNTIFDKSFTGAVRGELIIHEKSWKLLQGKYNNLIAPRNFAAGIINRKELDEDISYIDMVVYKIVGQENTPILSKRDEVLQWLSLNFKHYIPQYYYPVLNEQSWNAFHEQTFNTFKELGYGLDGLVLTSSDVIYNSQTQGYVYDECAFKFSAESCETVIKEIEWTLSRTQRLVPVAVVEPVELSGAIIQRATCNNAEMVKNWKLGKDARVTICRSNEVIPMLLEVIEESSEQLPEFCPCCGSVLVWDGVDLKCNYSKCPNIYQSDLQQWCEVIGETDGLQWTLMKQYLDNYNIHSINGLYENSRIVMNDLMTRKLSITEQKIFEFFNKLYTKDIPLEKALLALNIPRLGEKTSKLLSYEYDIIYKYLCYCLKIGDINVIEIQQKLLEIVKDATTESILNNKDKFINLTYLYNDIFTNNSRLILSTKSNSEIINVAVTGSLNTMKRDAFEKYINEFGYQLSSNLKKCKYLITNNPDSGSSKNKQAKQYGVAIITEQQFLDSLK